ncbi:MAG: hypothetical protein AMXMBFR61_06590 [Fimbriimonadales bacterium]
MSEPGLWKDDWPKARQAFTDWWAGKGLAVHITAPKDEPWEDVPPPPPDASEQDLWLDPDLRLQRELYRMANTFFGGVAFPLFDGDVGGPGSLGLFLGAEGHVAENTVWYQPCISDPDRHPPLRFDPENRWWKLHLEVLERAARFAEGRYLLGFPDLIENIDTLAQLRGADHTLMDLLERPEWVKKCLSEINAAYFEAYDRLLERVRDPWGGSAFTAFQLWGPGKTAKVQCDFSCMISPAMFREFVVPALDEQCRRMDFVLYHLDGTQALPHLDALLSIESIHAIEWTPQAGLPRGGDPQWYDLYRRIRDAGKSVQAVEVEPDHLLPLVDAVGTQGLFAITRAGSESRARELLRRLGW